jgi:hypothetical protein
MDVPVFLAATIVKVCPIMLTHGLALPPLGLR